MALAVTVSPGPAQPPALPTPARVDRVADLSAIVKAYDIRGVVGEQLDAPTVRDIGAAMARLLRAEDPGTGAVVVGHDMRDSSPELAAAFADGVTAQGLDVVSIGLASTDMLYFASGSLDLPGAMFTASHNPARYNGIKLCRAGASPIGQDTGLAADPGGRRGRGARRTRRRHRARARPARRVRRIPARARGPLGVRRLRVVVDAGNGMGGHTVPAVLGVAAAGPRADVLRARRLVPEPRGQPARPGEPRRPAANAWSRRAPTSGWPSTATPTAASSSTSAAIR